MTPQVRGNGSARDACDLSVVIVSWNVRELLRQCVRAVLDTRSGLDVEIIVVDNAGSDGSVEMIRREFPDVRIVALAKNIGFAAGNNRGIALSRGRHVLALNPDVIVGPGALTTMVAKLDRDAAVGALGARQLDERG
ncbi:MAG TPA: glycosyltransferase family 2 protein, partial [Planctomycetota bacterium]|nr:glycosyltransferase family 2 protein [Planctomycetota bacterium]